MLPILPILFFLTLANIHLSDVYAYASLGPDLIQANKICEIKPLGKDKDDTTQILTAIQKCGHDGHIILNGGEYIIKRKMLWNLVNSRVDIYGYLNFVPDIQYWLNPNNTYRVVFIQDQASWFVITGSNFTVDAHNTGGINGNGQPWWTYYTSPTHPRTDGDGRPISLTLSNATYSKILNFHIQSPPFWCNAIADSDDVIYEGMRCNATNGDAMFAGMNIVPNTDGIDTYRSQGVSLLNWDVTCGDDCLAIKGNSTDIHIKNITCRGGNGIAIGSLGQYVQLEDIVRDVVMEDLIFLRLDPMVQPNMVSGAYFKTFDGSVNGAPPTGGGGGGGFVRNVTARNVSLDRVDRPVHIYQTNDAIKGDKPSNLSLGNLAFVDWYGTCTTNELVDIECSPIAPCSDIRFIKFNVTTVNDTAPKLICQNVMSEVGLRAACNDTGTA